MTPMQTGFLENVDEVLEKDELERFVTAESSESSEFKDEIDDAFDRCALFEQGVDRPPVRLCSDMAMALSSSSTMSVCTAASE